MTFPLILFLAASVFLWISTLGYLLVLSLIALRRRHPFLAIKDPPQIAVVIPTLNEERFILGKLENLRLSDYPLNLMTVVVIDGGSSDLTTAIVEREIRRGQSIRLVRLSGAQGKAAQMNYALKRIPQDDADSSLAPSCIRELVSVLVWDPNTSVVGAVIKPASSMLEEQIHWQLLNFLWWLEGEVFSSSGVSGVCYAVRKPDVLPLPSDSLAEDVSLALSAAAGGFRTRLSRKARATELRVPQTPAELLEFRRRRGSAYRDALLSNPPESTRSARAELVRHIRLWHFRGAPQLAIVVAAASLALLATPYWPYALATQLAFVIPLIIAAMVSVSHASGARSWWRRCLAVARFLVLTMTSLLLLNRRTLRKAPVRIQS
jgi:cellulose synthase/poly-beta-1,6-N-acetylglucosamine synthase-like glycosyltransferase